MTIDVEQIANASQGEEKKQTPQTATFSYSDIEEGVKARLKRERERHEARLKEKEKENEELKNRLSELEKRVESGKATQSENLEYQQGLSAIDSTNQKVDQGMITRDQFEQVVKSRIQEEKAATEIQDAQEKDPEFKNLLAENGKLPPGQQLVNKDEVELMILAGIKNIPAVIKHLFKNQKDRQIMKLAISHAQRDGGVSLTNFLFDTSEKLELTGSRPKPNPYRESPNVNDIGTGDDFDESSYISEKYT